MGMEAVRCLLWYHVLLYTPSSKQYNQPLLPESHFFSLLLTFGWHIPTATVDPASSTCGKFGGSFTSWTLKKNLLLAQLTLNCRKSGNFIKSYCRGFLVQVSLWEESGHSGVAQHEELCSSEVRESGRIAQDGSRLLPVIRDRVNHSVTVMSKYKFLPNLLSKPNCSVSKIHYFCTCTHKKCTPWSRDQKFALPPPYPGTTVCTITFSSAPAFSASVASLLGF